MTTLDFCCSEALDLTPVDQHRVFKGMAALGAKHVRIGVPWAMVNPQRGQYSWQKMDWAITAAVAEGLIPDLTLIPPKPKFGWAWFAKDATAEDFATFCTAWVTHCKPLGVRSYELWNEPNNAAYWSTGAMLWYPGKVDAANFMSYFIPGSKAIKKADPSATVVFAGISSSLTSPLGVAMESVEWLKACYRAGLKGNYDVLAYHPYCNTGGGDFHQERPLSAQGAPHKFLDNVNRLRMVQADSGDLKPIWCNEYGFSTATLTQNLAAQWLKEETDYLRTLPYVERLYLFSYRNMVLAGQAYSPTTADMNYGIVDTALNPKGAIYDWATTANK